MAHADIDVNDDALCLKAGRDADGLRVNRPTEDVVIRDSVIRSGAAAVTFGSETSGGFHNIEAFNLTEGKGVGAGVLLKSAKVRGGGGSNLRIHDLHLTDVPIPIEVNLNWNPNYSYATLPPGVKDYPSYWDTLTAHVPQGQGPAALQRCAHLERGGDGRAQRHGDRRISGCQAGGLPH